MNKLVQLMTIVVLTLYGGIESYDAADKPQPRNFVIVEVTIGKENHFHKLKVPIASHPKERKIIEDQFDSGGFSFTGACPEDIGCEYLIISTADAVGKDKFKVMVDLSYKDRKSCNATKEFLVVGGKPIELKMKCNVRVKAYYDLHKVIAH